MRFLSSERLSEHKYKTPEGYLICTDAILARTGKQTYRKSEVFADSDDDSEIEVDRKAEEVFSDATLASFENKPITVEHPDEDVNSSNYNELSVGFVRDVHKGVAEGQDVMLGTLVITDAQTIAEIENGEHTDLSCGYDCDIVDEANPQQRNIRGNHVALCQQGRAGIARIVDSTNINDSKYFMATFETHSDKWGDDAYSIFIRANDIYEAEKKARERANIMNDKFLRIKEGNHSEYLKFRARGLAIDSVKDEDIFKVDVSSAEDRDVSRFITEAQNAGFTTEDKGYTIYLKNGNRDMLNKLKARTHTTAIKFVDSTKDSFAILHPKHYEFLSTGGRSWVKEDSTNIQKFATENEAIEFAKKYVNGSFRLIKLVDSVKDIAPTKASGTDKIVYIMQSDADSNLYFYIGKTFSMKEGAWGYTKYEMGSTSPEQLKAELTRNGWHEVNNGPAKIIDAQAVIFKGENTFIFANKDMIPERTHYKGDVDYNGKQYHYHEGFESKRKYLVPITDSTSNYNMYKSRIEKAIKNNNKQLLEEVKEAVMYAPTHKLSLQEQRELYKLITNSGITDSVKDDLVFGYTQKDLDLANNMLSKATTENEKKLIESLIAKIKYEITNKEMRDAEFNLSKYTSDYETTITKSGNSIVVELSEKDENNRKLIEALKNAGFRKVSSFRFIKDSNKKYEISYVEDSIEYIHIVRAKDLKDAIAKVKDGFYGGVEESKLRASNDFILKRLFAELDKLKTSSTLKEENEYYDIKQQIEARAKQIKHEFE